MKKYLRIFTLGIQQQLQHKANLTAYYLVGMVNPILFVMVWLNIIGTRESINGFTRSDFILYFIFINAGYYVVGGNFYNMIGNEIKTGGISKSLLKPYSILWEEYLVEQSWKLCTLFLVVPMVFLIGFLFKQYITIHFTYIQISEFTLSLVMASFIYALIQAIIGCLAFWLVDIWVLGDMIWIMFGVLGGVIVPITFLPSSIRWLAEILPFSAVYYVPGSILLNKSIHPVADLMFQAGYLFLLSAMLIAIWKLGLKKYEAVGG
ncbi:hypothetical protein HGB07_01545 [Candidatus Roizmanbacteria bacterium]|nr:hypothetical protein [Candidatus Roizmanbacteria bacterium]